MLSRFSSLLKALGLFLLALVLIWATGLFLFAVKIPDPLPDDSPLERTDAIVVLTGGSKRIDEGLLLLKRGLAEHLLISGVHENTPIDDLLRGPSFEALEEKITLGREALDTFGNAVEAAIWVRDNEDESLRLVTANYHMPRALLEFHRQFSNIRIVPHPVAPEHFKKDGWWMDAASRKLVLSEYHKTLASYVREGLVAFLEGS
ncbi:MAG: YdcF family protein [Alphaproteobacteria bacterium]|nr:YdcF family protein [Alphaproteobacteria bacterium]